MIKYFEVLLKKKERGRAAENDKVREEVRQTERWRQKGSREATERGSPRGR